MWYNQSKIFLLHISCQQIKIVSNLHYNQPVIAEIQLSDKNRDTMCPAVNIFQSLFCCESLWDQMLKLWLEHDIVQFWNDLFSDL